MIENVRDSDRQAHLLELRRLVQNGEYRVDSLQVAAAIVKSEYPEGTAKGPAGENSSSPFPHREMPPRG
jgi:hypothetical protein